MFESFPENFNDCSSLGDDSVLVTNCYIEFFIDLFSGHSEHKIYLNHCLNSFVSMEGVGDLAQVEIFVSSLRFQRTSSILVIYVGYYYFRFDIVISLL